METNIDWKDWISQLEQEIAGQIRLLLGYDLDNYNKWQQKASSKIQRFLDPANWKVATKPIKFHKTSALYDDVWKAMVVIASYYHMNHGGYEIDIEDDLIVLYSKGYYEYIGS